MQKMTRKLGRTEIPANADLLAAGEIKRVLISRANHRLGNLLLVTPLIQEVHRTLPGATIDLFVKGGIAPVLFSQYACIGRIIQLPRKPGKNIWAYLAGWMAIRRNRYDLVINVVNLSSSGRLSAWFANARYRFLGEINAEIRLRCPDHEHMARYPVYSFRYFINNVSHTFTNAHPVPMLDMKLTPTEIEEGRRLLRDLAKNAKPTICLYTYATGVKCYSPEWWGKFYEMLKARYPSHNIIEVLPIENVSQINFHAPSFYSKDLRQIAALIANTDVFVGADSGMMHLASAAKTPTLGLFKANNINTYAPYGNNSRGVSTQEVVVDGLVDMVGGMMRPVPYEEGMLDK